MSPFPGRNIELFISYSHADGEIKRLIDNHLSAVKREGIIRVWHDGLIQPGDLWDEQIRKHLERSDIVVLLISSDFLASEYCNREMERALERHELGEARVIPIIARPCDWEHSPFAKLQALPQHGKPISTQLNFDVPAREIAEEIRAAARHLLSRGDLEMPLKTWSTHSDTLVETVPKEIELTIDKEFSEFTPDDQHRLLSAIKHILETDSDLKIIRKRPGSVKLTIQLSPKQAERLLWAIKQGQLESHNVVDANIATLTDVSSISSASLEETLMMSTAEIGLSVRTTNCLEEKGIYTVDDLLKCTKKELLSISNFGEKTLEEIYSALKSIGFH